VVVPAAHMGQSDTFKSVCLLNHTHLQQMLPATQCLRIF